MIKNDFAAIAALDLAQIKVKLMHSQSGEGWSREKADAVEAEYRRFLYLMKKNPEAQGAPLVDVDTFWHYHILDTRKYIADCEEVFGHYLHHYPYLGLHGEDDEELHLQAGQRMKELYEESFGKDSFALAARQIDNPGEGASVTAWCYIPPAPVKPVCSDIVASRPATAWCYIPPAQALGPTDADSRQTRPAL
ncbi:MAG TPA: glycine-rich domain-containing protein-like [Telluria sp.]